MPRFEGVIPPIITPYDAEGNLHETALRQLVDWYAEAGCTGLWACGGTGESGLLSCDERVRMVELLDEYVERRMQIIFHVCAATTADAVAAATRCQELGIDAICSMPPFCYGKSRGEIVDYYARLADATDRPIFLYNLPDVAGVQLTLPIVEAIVERVPSVVGIKQSARVADFVLELLRFKPDLQVLIGRGETTLAALVMGAQGVVCASLCMAPERFVAIYKAFQAADLRGAMAAQKHATQVKELFTKFPVIASTKWVNSKQLGIDCGSPREPLAPIKKSDEAAIEAMATELGLLERTAALTKVLNRRPVAVRPR